MVGEPDVGEPDVWEQDVGEQDVGEQDREGSLEITRRSGSTTFRYPRSRSASSLRRRCHPYGCTRSSPRSPTTLLSLLHNRE